MTKQLFQAGTEWMAKALRAVKDDPWMYPIIGFEGSEHISLEWNYEDRRLNVYLQEDGKTSYVTLVGEDKPENMNNGSCDPQTDFPRLWQWLIGG